MLFCFPKLASSKSINEDKNKEHTTRRTQALFSRADRTFAFRQFAVYDGSCGMKVGTDGVMLGLFASYMQSERLHKMVRKKRRELRRASPPFGRSIRVLDVGCGSGIVGLIVVQHLVEIVQRQQEQATDTQCAKGEKVGKGDGESPLPIELFGIDIDSGACVDTQRNYDAAVERNVRADGVWSAAHDSLSLKALCCDARSTDDMQKRFGTNCQYRGGFDIIVCNPPFFDDVKLLPAHKCTEQQRISIERKRARFQSSLPPSDVARLFSTWLLRNESNKKKDEEEDGERPLSFGALIYPTEHAKQMRDAIEEEASSAASFATAASSSSSSVGCSVAHTMLVKDNPAKESPIRVIWLIDGSDKTPKEEDAETLCIYKSERSKAAAKTPQEGESGVPDQTNGNKTDKHHDYTDEYAKYCRHVYPFVE